MIVGLDFLNSIKGKIICVMDENRIEFTCGEDAKNYYINEPGVYSIKRIMIEDGMLVVSLNYTD